MKDSRAKKKIRVRKKISGTTEQPRISVFRSLNHVYAQIIDDTTGTTLAAASSLSKDIVGDIKGAKSKIEKSNIVGKFLADQALKKGIESVVFDRNTYRYHGRVQAIADGAREGGLKF